LPCRLSLLQPSRLLARMAVKVEGKVAMAVATEQAVVATVAGQVLVDSAKAVAVAKAREMATAVEERAAAKVAAKAKAGRAEAVAVVQEEPARVRALMVVAVKVVASEGRRSWVG